MQTIDFLPERYRQATSRRRTSYWRFVVTVLFVAAFAATAYALDRTRREVRAEHARVEQRLQTARQSAAAVTPRAAELEHVSRYADLLTFLRHPWPRSRIVETVLASLPASVTLDKLRLNNVAKPVVSTEGAADGETADAATADAAADLATLRRDATAVDVVVLLEGTTRDPAELYAYVQRLGASDLIAEARLTSIEAAGSGEPVAAGKSESGAVRFALEARVRPGWGLPGGPRSAPAAEVSAAQADATLASGRKP